TPTATAPPAATKEDEQAHAPAATGPPAAVVRAEALPAVSKQSITAGGTGVVAWAAERSGSVEDGAPLIKLAGYMKWEAKLKDALEREGFYAKKLAEAQAKNEPVAIEAAQHKVDEKKEIID